MANTRISNLTASASNLAASDLVPVVQTPNVGPVKMTGTQIKTGIIGAGSVSIASGKTFTSSNTLTLAGTDSTTITFGSASSSFPIVTSPTAATLQLGAADAAAPVAQTLQVQSVAAGTSNTAGTNFTINGSKGTGTGAGGSIIFQVAPAGSSGTAQNAYVTALSILNPASNNVMLRLLSNNAYIKSTDANTFAIGDFNSGSSSINYGIQVRPLANDTGLKTSIGITIAGGAFGSNETLIYSDAANTLALRNGTSAQLFRVYSTYNGTNDAYGAIGAAVNLDGTAGDANTLYIGSQKKGSPTALTKLAIQVDGTTQLDYASTTASAWSSFSNWNIRPASGASSTTYWYAGSAYIIFGCSGGADSLINGSAFGDMCLRSNAKNILLSVDNGTTYALRINSSNLLQFQGTTSSFPALKRSSATLQVRLADDSAFSDVSVRGAIYNGVTFANLPGTPTTGTVAYVTDASNAGAAWGDSVTAGGSTNKYLVWYNGTNWTVVGK